MQVSLLHNTPLWVCSTAIRKCWASEDKSDTEYVEDMWNADNGWLITGPKDKELIHRVGNKNKHSSTLEHLVYTFDIDGISRACLQELARHRHASMSVKSTRYTLKELKEAINIDDFVVYTGDKDIDWYIAEEVETVKLALNKGIPSDKVKFMLPEAYKTSLVWTINARALQNFLSLRTNKAALWEIRELAYEIFNQLPEEHKYLFQAFLYKED